MVQYQTSQLFTSWLVFKNLLFYESMKLAVKIIKV